MKLVSNRLFEHSRNIHWNSVFKTSMVTSSYSIVACMLLGAALSTSPNVSLAQTGGTNSDEGERGDKAMHEQDLGRIESARQARDLRALEQLGDAIESRWEPNAGEPYFILMCKLCDVIGTYDFANPEMERALEQKYARLALAKDGAIPLETHLRLVAHLCVDLEYTRGAVKGEAWSKLRAEKADLWFQAWQRLERETDEGFDFDDRAWMNVMPPEGVNLPAGVAPEHIKAPQLRAEYEAAIAKNSEKVRKRNWQYKLRQLDKWFSPFAERYIIGAYSRPPFDLPGLTQKLDAFLQDPDRKQRILSAVIQKIQ